MARMVLGVFNNRWNAEDAINELEHSGYDAKDISIIMRDENEGQVLANNTGSSVETGIASGVTTGVVIGAVAGLLTGIGAIAIPGLGAILIGGPIAAALGLTGAAATTVTGAVTGGIAGGLVGALIGLGIPEEDARVYESRIKEGGILVAVPAASSDREERAQSVLANNGADQIRSISTTDRVHQHYEEPTTAAYYHDLPRGRQRRVEEIYDDDDADLDDL